MTIDVALIALAAYALSLWLESYAVPRGAALRLAGGWMKLPVFVVFYGTAFALTYRPIFSGTVVFLGLAVLLACNAVKFRALREPLIFSDFVLFKQAFAHRRLYLDYLGPGPLSGGIVIIAALIYGGLALETPVWTRDGVTSYVPGMVFFSCLGIAGLAMRQAPVQRAVAAMLRRYRVALDPARDVERLGLVATLAIYWGLWLGRTRQPAGPSHGPFPNDHGVGPAQGSLPDVIAIQNESFFDVRRVGDAVDPELLAAWDACTAEASSFGCLEVPAWGANTMRTEFTFLTGIPYDDLGLDKFNPYLAFAKQPLWSIVRHLKHLGYRTICIHPYKATFFDRCEVFPQLGFDDFLDIEAFEGAETFGPYVGDLAVGDKILEVLDRSSGPVFIFAITMENHGQWSENRLADIVGEPPLPRDESLPMGSAAFYIYLRHLANTDRMLHELTAGLKRRDRECVMCMFGDHMPSLESVFARAGYEDTRTDYVIWRTTPGAPEQRDARTDELPFMLMSHVTSDDAPYRAPDAARAALHGLCEDTSD